MLSPIINNFSCLSNWYETIFIYNRSTISVSSINPFSQVKALNKILYCICYSLILY